MASELPTSVTPTKDDGDLSASRRLATPSSTTAAPKESNVDDIKTADYFLSSLEPRDFQRLCFLLDISGGKTQIDLAKFLNEVGCSTLKDLAFVDEKDFAESQYQLPKVLRRKLLVVGDFVKHGGCLQQVATMDEIMATSATRSSSSSNEGGGASQTSGGADAAAPPTPISTGPHAESNAVNEEGGILELNVGGYRFTTSRETLCRVPNTVLEAIVSGRHPNPARRGQDGSYFIDRNGKYFDCILDYLRLGGNVGSPLPVSEADRHALAMEADYYGLEGLVRAIQMPKVDIDEHLGEETLKFRREEKAMREAFAKSADGSPFSSLFSASYSKNPRQQGLIPLFCPHDGIRPLPLKYEPPESVPEGKVLYMSSLRKNEDPETAVTVETLGEFRMNFNRNHPNVLHRLDEVLREEPVIIAGGSVLQALTSSPYIRTSFWWGGKSDIDLFVHCRDAKDASRIAERIFRVLAVDNERWVVMRSRGVITMHSWVTHGWSSTIEQKVQIVLRLYDSPAEVLYGFDCDSCCCAYDGKEVWVTPRWVYALRHGINVLNPLHAWPNKPSYELRLAKYASRGFAVAVPGLDLKRVDYDKIHSTKLDLLKGLARLVKIAISMETHKQVEGYSSTPRHVESLKPDVIDEFSACDIVVNGMSGYDERPEDVIIPDVYCQQGNGEFATGEMWFDHIGGDGSEFPMFDNEVRRDAWKQISNAGNDVPDGVPRRLSQAWDDSKRSREYLNANLDSFDLDNIYYDFAYVREEKPTQTTGRE